MIEFQKTIKIYSHRIEDIYCCDCVFEKVASLLFSTKEFTCDEFVKILEEKYANKNLFIQVFSYSILIVCKPTIKLILDNKKNFEQVIKRSCITDLVDFANLKIKICLVCLMEIIERSQFLKKFKLKIGNDYLFM